MEAQDQEVTLGTGRLLGLFFGLVIVCALFFSLGFTLGRRGAADALSAAGVGTPHAAAEARPSASRNDEVKTEAETQARPAADELTFYKAVEQNEPSAKLETPTHPSVRPATQLSTRTMESKPVSHTPPRLYAPGSGYMVQVAAVTKQDDAEALVHALRRKSYPVLMTSGSNDKLYHVQVGPFGDVKDAEAMRSKLIGDGYNPILKK